MSSGKRFVADKRQLNDKELEVKLRLFERLSKKGFLQSMQQQMRRAIAEEFRPNDGTNGDINDSKANKDNDLVLNGMDSDPLAKLSSIANWEKQIRHELEIDKEIQIREIERQREKLKNDLRRLDEKDRCLRIELDSRERKIRLREEELQKNIEDMNDKRAEMTAKEEMINAIVDQKVKIEMKEEIEKLKKKFNELETNKSNLIKREEKIKEVEQRLHSQVQIVKEKIDNKRLSEIELAKSRKDLEIIKKENEVLRQRVDSMEDYSLTRFENKSLKSELNAIKETLKTKLSELEAQREGNDLFVRQSEEKCLALRMDLRKCEHELLLLKQKHQGHIDQYDNQVEQLNGQLKQSRLLTQQLRHKNVLLSKEIINNENHKSNNNLTQIDGQKFGCYICDHNIKALEDSSLEFLVSQKYGFESQKKFIGEEKLDLHSVKSSAIGFKLNEEKVSKNAKRMQTEVPLSDKTKTTTHAIQHNTCAKHNQNGIQSKHITGDNKQTIDGRVEDMKYETNVFNNNNNNVSKHKDLGSDNNDISASFEW